MAQKFWYPWKHETNVYANRKVQVTLRCTIDIIALRYNIYGCT